MVVDARSPVHEYWVTRGRRKVTTVSWMWAVLAGTTSIVATLCRDLVSLRRHAVRRASIERMVQENTGLIRIVDRTAEGDLLETEILTFRAANVDPPGLGSMPGEP